MRFNKDQFTLWCIVLFIGAAAIAVPMADNAGLAATADVKERQDHPVPQASKPNEGAYAKDVKHGESAVGLSIGRQDYYDRRREYWEDRLERRLEDEDLDDESGDKDDEADSKDKKDSKAAKNDGEDTAADEEYERIERRREYWRERVEREW